MGGLMWLFGLTIFLGAFLLFQVQPLVAKLILPWFGGTAAVWATCLAFFQTALLAGYLYSHGAVLRLTPRRQRGLHAILLAASLAFLPIGLSEAWKPAPADQPSLRILAALAASIGLPYLMLATTSPLMQAWIVQTRPGAVPYRFFALSNLGSMLALLSYPVLAEPELTLRQQRLAWSAAFAVFACLCMALAWRTRAASEAPPPPVEDEETEDQPVAWVALAAAPSMLLVALTSYITQDVASIPFLWILPLSIYLLTFILSFDAPRWYWRPAFLAAVGPVLALVGYLVWSAGLHKPEAKGMIVLLSASLFVLCMFCHGELARRRPHPRYLTRYYLMIALGGALGGAFVALLAPALFRSLYELPIALTLVAFLLVAAVWKLAPGPALSWSRIGLMVAFASFAGFSVRIARDFTSDTLAAARNFYGELRVKEYDEAGEDGERYRVLLHGLINHGEQFVRPSLHRKLAHYYCPDTGIGRLMEARGADGPWRVGVLGLGAGALAAFGRAGDDYRFYEINPQVEVLARHQFTYLAETPAKVTIVEGDGRLSLEREPPQNFDVLLMDAFSGDAIPIHLLTLEAMRTYLRHLKPGGVLVVHITNQNVDLEPVMAAAAGELGLSGRLITTPGDDSTHCYKTRFALLTRNPHLFDAPAFRGAAHPLQAKPGVHTWTDDYSNLLRVLK
ncbi:MAG: fused MFS/spermidine synthase [Bryobacterales bacterium]|nr:fused MFS/spermidine synthase [Bryobacterales bacterium]